MSLFKIAMGCLLLTAINASAESDLLTDEKYESFRDNFLDTSKGIYEIDVKKLSAKDYASVTSNLNQTYRSPFRHPYGFSFDERNGSSFTSFGRGGACLSKFGEKSICFDSTGGTLGRFYEEPKKGHCGSQLGFGSTLPIKGSDALKICDKSTLPANILVDNKVPWSGYRFWLGLYNDDMKVNSGYLRDKIPNASGVPFNRMCFEMELDTDNLHIVSPKSDLDTGKRVLVNGDVAPKLANIGVNLGTYTSVITKTVLGSETSGNEVGGVFGTDQSHFYHVIESSNPYPNDKAFAIDKDTFIYCAGDQPVGVRTSMKTGYVNNPLADMFPNDENGYTNGLNYWNYVTRLYVNINGLGQGYVNHPFRSKLKRIFLMYEPNDIMLLAADGKSTVSTQFAEDTAPKKSHSLHHVTLRNFATNDRHYRFYQNSIKQIPDTKPNSKFEVYVDANKNGTIDSSDRRLNPYDTLKVSARTDVNFLVKQENHFSFYYNYTVRSLSNRRVITNKFGLREIGRLRSAGISIRTWETLKGENLNTEKFLKHAGYHDYEARIKPSSLKTGMTYSVKFRIGSKEHALSVVSESSDINKIAAQLQLAMNNELNNNHVTVSVVDDYIKFSGSYKRFSFIRMENLQHAYVYPDNSKWFIHRKKNHEKPNNPYMIKNTVDYLKAIGSNPKKVKNLRVR